MGLTHGHRAHIMGDKDAEFQTLPDLTKKAKPKKAEEERKTSKFARRTDWMDHEKRALIDEDGQATNATKLDIKGTHYEASQEDQDVINWPFGF